MLARNSWFTWVAVWGVAWALVAGCSGAGGGRGRGAGKGGAADAGTVCVASDTDGDGIDDTIEGNFDLDGDGVPNPEDTDSDGDGVDDRDEARSEDPCGAVDSDLDGNRDFLDTDSDNDGLTDDAETTAGTDPRVIDTDGDGVSDLGEVRGTRTDPLDPTSTVDSEDFFLVLPYEGEPEERELRFGTDIEVADFFFLVDMTGSMGGVRSNLIRWLNDKIIPGIQAEVADAQFGVGGFDDYPYGAFGAGNDRPFYLLREIAPFDQDAGAFSLTASADVCPMDAASADIGTIGADPNGRPDLLEAVEGLPCHGGSDGPESYVPALYATATGHALKWPSGSTPPQACPTVPDEVGMRRGYPCFRPGALPIVLLFGDNDFHNGPGGALPYGFEEAPTYEMTVEALNAIGARVIGVRNGGASGDFNRIATDTGAVRVDGSPLVFPIDSSGTGVDTAVVDAVVELVGGTPQDVDTSTHNVRGNPDDFDATTFIKGIVPVEGYPAGGGVGGYERKVERGFDGVIPGTQVVFNVEFRNDVRPATESAEIFRATIIVRGNGVAELDTRHVYIVVPPADGVVLI